MKEVMDIYEFCKQNNLDIESNQKESVTLRVNKVKLKYIKYLSYEFDKPMSSIFDEFVVVNRDDFSKSSGANMKSTSEPYATTKDTDAMVEYYHARGFVK